MEYIQADTWVRAQRMQGNAVNFVGADDAHGAPIMIAAEKAGKTPQQFVADIAAGRKQYLDGFHIAFDNWSNTDSAENHELSRQIYLDLKRPASSSPAPSSSSSTPRRTCSCPTASSGRMPALPRQGPVRRQLRSLQLGLRAHRPHQPVLGPVGATPVMKSSEHFFFKLSDPRAVEFLTEWTQNGKHVQPSGGQDQEWFGVRTNPDGSTSEGLDDWDISRDAPYFGIEIPDAPGKYFYVWLDAPVGYLASLKELLNKRGEDYNAYMADPDLEQYHFIGKDIITFHTLFWPAMLKFSGRKTPTRICVHGFMTVNNGEKMSKSRGTGLDPLKYLSLKMNPEWLRYYLGAKLNGKNEDIDFNPEDFMLRVNSDLIGKYVNIASRAAGFISKRFDGKLGVVSEDGQTLLAALREQQAAIVAAYEARDTARRARDHAAVRQGQQLCGRQQALGAGQEGRHGCPPARCVHDLHRSLPHPDHLPEPHPARRGRRSRQLPHRAARELWRCGPASGPGPPDR